MSRRTPALTLAVALVAIAGLALSACGSDADTAATTTTAAKPAAVEVSLVDYAFQGLPKSVEAGSTLTVVNKSKAELHEMVVFPLADGEQRTADELAALSPDELAAVFGGEPTAVLMAPPGGPTIKAVGDGVLTKPGRYAVFCFIPTGIDPAVYLEAAAKTEAGPPQVEGGGPPHFVNGMRATLTVT